MKNAVLVFIGAGNMGHSLIGGLINNGYPPQKIWATDPHEEKLQHLAAEYGIHTTTENNVALNSADVVILAVKPQIMAQVIKKLASVIQQRRPLIISIAAGIPVNHLQIWLGEKLSIVRCMPNTPAMLRCGATGLYANEVVSVAQKELAQFIMQAVGLTLWMENEAQMDIVTALSGSGPAYFFLIMEALEQGAIELGLSAEVAHMLTLQTALGAARMALESSNSTAQLRKNVTSPGGTTERALQVLQENKIPAIFTAALKAAQQRAEELAAMLSP